MKIVDVLREQATALDRPMSQVAIAWILARLPASIPIVGIKRRSQLEDAIQAITLSLPAETQRRLDEVSGSGDSNDATDDDFQP